MKLSNENIEPSNWTTELSYSTLWRLFINWWEYIILIYGRSGPTTHPAPVDAAPVDPAPNPCGPKPIRPQVDPAPYYLTQNVHLHLPAMSRAAPLLLYP